MYMTKFLYFSFALLYTIHEELDSIRRSCSGLNIKITLGKNILGGFSLMKVY